jgi:hypothetical protein
MSHTVYSLFIVKVFDKITKTMDEDKVLFSMSYSDPLFKNVECDPIQLNNMLIRYAYVFNILKIKVDNNSENKEVFFLSNS